MINIENLGKRLRIIREFFKFTQQQMADVLQMNPSTYKNNERGLHAIQINNLEPLHNELGISVEWLLFEKEPFLWKDIQIIEKKEVLSQFEWVKEKSSFTHGESHPAWFY